MDRWTDDKVSQWAGVLLGPAAWAVHLQGSYTLSAFACEAPWRLSVHALFVVSLAMALAGLYIGWRNRQMSNRAGPEGHRLDRSRFMAVAGIGLSAFFAIVIVAQWIPTLFLEPCRY